MMGDPMANRRWEGGAAEEAILTAFANRQAEVAEAIKRGEAVETGSAEIPDKRYRYCIDARIVRYRFLRY
jgi:hypothetical protein